MTGWKVGYVIAPKALSRAVRMSHQFIVNPKRAPEDFFPGEMLTLHKVMQEMLFPAQFNFGRERAA